MSSERTTILGPILLARSTTTSVTFFRDRLGLRGDAIGPSATLRSGDARIVRLDRRFWAKATGGRRGGGRNAVSPTAILAIRVPHVVRTHRALAAAGVRLEVPSTGMAEMGNRITVRHDPDAHRVEPATPSTAGDVARLRRERPPP